MDKKPQLFVNKIDKILKNNESVYYSSENNTRNIAKKETKKNNKNVIQKINSIFTSPNYVYKAEVRIKLKDKEIVKKVVGRNSSNLITMDNELIPIKDIIDINKN